MKINKETLKRSVSMAGLKCKKHAPQIMMVCGVVGVVTAGVTACVATTKASEIVNTHVEEMEAIHKASELSEEYTSDDIKKDTAIVYAQTSLKFVKLYGPSVLLAAASLGCIIGSHRILCKRNAALASAYIMVDNQFKNYRKNVKERFGTEVDKEIKYNVKTEKVEEKVVDKKGNEKVKTKEVRTSELNNYSEYARVFETGNLGWTKDPEANKHFILQCQAYANQKLKSKGYLFLNDVYEMFNYPPTKAGQIVGWIYGDKSTGDGYVDFGVFSMTEENINFINGFESNIIMDFNVDGPILDLI